MILADNEAGVSLRRTKPNGDAIEWSHAQILGGGATFVAFDASGNPALVLDLTQTNDVKIVRKAGIVGASQSGSDLTVYSRKVREPQTFPNVAPKLEAVDKRAAAHVPAPPAPPTPAQPVVTESVWRRFTNVNGFSDGAKYIEIYNQGGTGAAVVVDRAGKRKPYDLTLSMAQYYVRRGLWRELPVIKANDPTTLATTAVTEDVTVRRFRHYGGFSDNTDYIEVIGAGGKGKSFLVTKTGTRRDTPEYTLAYVRSIRAWKEIYVSPTVQAMRRAELAQGLRAATPWYGAVQQAARGW